MRKIHVYVYRDCYYWRERRVRKGKRGYTQQKISRRKTCFNQRWHVSPPIIAGAGPVRRGGDGLTKIKGGEFVHIRFLVGVFRGVPFCDSAPALHGESRQRVNGVLLLNKCVCCVRDGVASKKQMLLLILLLCAVVAFTSRNKHDNYVLRRVTFLWICYTHYLLFGTPQQGQRRPRIRDWF